MSEITLTPKLTRPPPVETLLQLTHAPTFPLYITRLVKSEDETTTCELRVEPSIYDHLLKIYGTNEIVLYWNIPTTKIEAWTPDMLFTMRLLSRMGVMSSADQWIAQSRQYIKNTLSETKSTESKTIPNDQALNKTKDVLRATGLLEAVDNKADLFQIAKDVINSKTKDPDSTIYRLAMAIFHSEGIAGQNILPELDPGEAYLRMSQDQAFLSKYTEVKEQFDIVAASIRSNVMKTFICFVAASYVYFRVVSGE